MVQSDRSWVFKSCGINKKGFSDLFLDNSDFKGEPFNAGKYLEQKINKKTPLLIKNEPENP